MILRTEFKLTLREPIGAAFSLGLPLVLLLVFGIPDAARASRTRTSTARCRSTP